MSTVLALMDRPGWEAMTDNVVVVQPSERRLLWVPRDLWVESAGMRLNAVYAKEGEGELLSALRELGVEARHVMCVQREAAEALLAHIDVTVPVPRHLRYWYPLEPMSEIEDGRKVVSFRPPSERLSGERVHEWLGARLAVEGPTGGDLDRIARQQVFVAEVLRQGFAPGGLIRARPDLFSISDPGALADLARIEPEWRMDTLGPLATASIRGQVVLVRRRRPGRRGDIEVKYRVRRLGGELVAKFTRSIHDLPELAATGDPSRR